MLFIDETLSIALTMRIKLMFGSWIACWSIIGRREQIAMILFSLENNMNSAKSL